MTDPAAMPWWRFVTAGRIGFGPGVSRHLPAAVHGLGNRVLIATDPTLVGARVVAPHAGALTAVAGTSVLVCDEGEAEIGFAGVEKCAAAVCDFAPEVAGVGGGSNIDLAKVIATRLPTPRPVAECAAGRPGRTVADAQLSRPGDCPLGPGRAQPHHRGVPDRRFCQPAGRVRGKRLRRQEPGARSAGNCGDVEDRAEPPACRGRRDGRGRPASRSSWAACSPGWPLPARGRASSTPFSTRWARLPRPRMASGTLR